MAYHNKPFTHSFITLFNIGFQNIVVESFKKVFIDYEEWFENRLRIFKSLTAKSVLSFDHNFDWLIVIDKNTPHNHHNKILEAVNYDCRVKILQADHNIPFMSRHAPWFVQFIHDHLDKSKDLILTTLIDNDDLVADNFCDKLYESVYRHLNGPYPIMFEPKEHYNYMILIKKCHKVPINPLSAISTTPSILDRPKYKFTSIRSTRHGLLSELCMKHVTFPACSLHTVHKTNYYTHDWYVKERTMFKFNVNFQTIINKFKSIAKKRCILILSIPRSGSSCTAGCLELLGCSLGKHPDLSIDKYNAKGYFENAVIGNFNSKRCKIFYPEKLDDTDWKSLADIIKTEFDNSDLFLLKDPRIIQLFTCYERALQSLDIYIEIVLLYRNKESCKKSMQNFLPSEHLNELELNTCIDWYNKEINKIRNRHPSFLLNFENIRNEIENLAEWLGLQYDEKVISNFIDEKLIHY